jgi:hypothetical protein
MVIVYTDKCRYEIQEQKEVSVWYTGPFRALVKCTNYENVFVLPLFTVLRPRIFLMTRLSKTNNTYITQLHQMLMELTKKPDVAVLEKLTVRSVSIDIPRQISCPISIV